MERADEVLADLDTSTIRFTISEQGELQAGDTLVIREIEPTEDGVTVAAIPEKVIRAEVEKLFD